MLPFLTQRTLRALSVLSLVGACASIHAASFPNPAADSRLAKAKATVTAVLAGGCFWGVEAVFKHVKGVVDVVSGYAGGIADTAQYDKVSSGRTGHAEAVRITYDPSQVSYGQLLKVFVPYAPVSHPFVERLIGTIRREYLDRTFFWNAVDLARKLDEFRHYYNAYRVHRGLDGFTPAQRAGAPSPAPATLDRYGWRVHCRELFQTPVPA